MLSGFPSFLIGSFFLLLLSPPAFIPYVNHSRLPASRTEMVGLPIKIKILVSNDLVDDAILDQRKIVELLSSLDGKKYWSTVAQAAYLSELEKVAKLEKAKRQNYLSALKKMDRGLDESKLEHLAKAEVLMLEAQREFTESLGGHSLSGALMLEHIGHTHLLAANYEAAKKFYLLANESWKPIVGGDHLFIGINLANAGLTELRSGKAAESVAYFKESLELQRNCVGTKNPSYPVTLAYLADALIQIKNHAEAKRLALEAASIVGSVEGETSLAAAYTQLNLGNLDILQSDDKNAEAHLERSLKLIDSTSPWCLIVISRIYDGQKIILKK